jgi:hypothetical protein
VGTTEVPMREELVRRASDPAPVLAKHANWAEDNRRGYEALTAPVYWIPTFMACLFPDAVQDEVFSTPDVPVCGKPRPSGRPYPPTAASWSTGSGASSAVPARRTGGRPSPCWSAATASRTP